MRRTGLTLLTILFLLFTAGPAFAQNGRGPGQAVFGRSLEVRPGEVIEGDVFVAGGNLRVRAGGKINGDATVFGGSAVIEGEVDGNLAVFGGDARLASTAVVDGDVFVMGGRIERAPGAVVTGETVTVSWWRLGLRGFVGEPAEIRPFQRDGRPLIVDFLLNLFSAGVISVGVTVLGVLVVLLLPQHTEVVAHTAAKEPAASLGVGVLTLIAAAFVLPLLFLVSAVLIIVCVGFVGLLLGILLAVGLAVAGLFGWIAVGTLVGSRILRALNVEQAPTPLLATALGVLLLSIFALVPWAVPCIGWFLALTVMTIFGNLGLGAVVLTRFGTRPYPVSVTGPPAPQPPL